MVQNESGALNEATSDILGEATSFWAGKGDWKIAANIYTPVTPGDALRYMDDPTRDGRSSDYYPEREDGDSCTPTGMNDNCWVHRNSGIANLFFYLLSQGGSHPRQKTTVLVLGIGIEKAQQI
jgi:vibriolysin